MVTFFIKILLVCTYNSVLIIITIKNKCFPIPLFLLIFSKKEPKSILIDKKTLCKMFLKNPSTVYAYKSQLLYTFKGLLYFFGIYTILYLS